MLEHLIVLIRNLYTDQEATVWAEHGETDQLEDCVLFPYLLNIHAEHILKEAVLEENKSSFKIRGEKKITCAMLMTLF